MVSDGRHAVIKKEKNVKRKADAKEITNDSMVTFICDRGLPTTVAESQSMKNMAEAFYVLGQRHPTVSLNELFDLQKEQGLCSHQTITRHAAVMADRCLKILG